MAPMPLSLGSGAPTAAKICPTERMYCSTLCLWMGLLLAARTPERTLRVNICKKEIFSLMPWRLLGMCNHVEKVSHCFYAVLSLHSLEVERPSATAL